MSKRETPPSPYSEATVVQTRTPNPPTSPDTRGESGTGEKTIVHARSNLKETFDAHTVVRTSNSLPKDMPAVPKAVSPKIPDVPKKTEMQWEHTGGAVQTKSAETEEIVKKTKISKTPREPRKPLDQRTKLFIAGGTALAILIMIFVISGGDSANEPKTTAQQNTGDQPYGEESMASQEQSDEGVQKFQQLPGPPPTTTTDVLNRFDRAALRAQQRAEQYSGSSGGF